MKRHFIFMFLAVGFLSANAQQNLTLEECRRLALEHNKNYKIQEETLQAATQLKRSAFTQLLPNFSVNAAYTWNERNISLLSENAMLPVGSMGANGSIGTGISATSQPTPNANGTFSFKDAAISNNFALLGGKPVPLDANGKPFDPSKNPEKLLWKNYALLPKEAMEFDMQNIFVGSVTMVQPIFMGGKILELNNISKYNEKIALAQKKNKATEILVEVDEAYWRVISVANKLKLAEQYRDMLKKIDTNVQNMMAEGVATKADALKVKVKLNEIEIMVTKAENGLNLSKMALNQLCGLDMNSDIALADQSLNNVTDNVALVSNDYSLEKRPEIEILTQLTNIAKSNEKVMFSRFLPNIGLTANYLVSNPNAFNGFSKTFDGMFNVGVVASVPLFHFGDKIHTYKAAKHQYNIAKLELEEAKEKMTLQVKQSTYKLIESIKKQHSTSKNIENAEENLRLATEGFGEGVISSTDLLAAQTAWLSVKSDDIDARIDIKLNELYLKRNSGEMSVEQYSSTENAK